MTAGGILIQMNTNGNPSTLVAAHPGNTNAVKYGVYSPRANAPRAAEIAAQLHDAFDFSVTQSIAVSEVAHLMAILEAIDRDIEERDVVDKRGEPRSVLNYRSRISRQLDHWLTKITPTMERQAARELPSPPLGRSDYVAELQRIARGDDTTATTRDRMWAFKELAEIDAEPGGVTVVHLSIPADRMPPRLRPTPPEGEHEPTDDDSS